MLLARDQIVILRTLDRDLAPLHQSNFLPAEGGGHPLTDSARPTRPIEDHDEIAAGPLEQAIVTCSRTEIGIEERVFDLD